MISNSELECHSDSGFSKEQELGYGIRGANFMRSGTSRDSGKGIYHLIDSQCKSHKHVTRSSFSSEVRAAVSAIDELIPMALTLHEFGVGVAPMAQTRAAQESAETSIKTILTTDSLSLWTAVAASTMKVPSEKTLAVHLYWVRDLLEKRALHTLRWCDTRDMTADAHTKGSIPRDALLSLMSGRFEYSQAIKDYSDPRPRD